MKNLRLLALIAALCLTLAVPVLAQNRRPSDVLPTDAPLVSIEGPITKRGPDFVVVNCLTVHWTDETEIVGQLCLGAEVEIEAYVLPDDHLVAKSIRVVPALTCVAPRIVTFGGYIQSIGEPVWVIGDREVTVTSCTIIMGEPQVGRWAKVRALRRSNGELLALFINVWPNWPETIEFSGRIERLPPNLMGRWVVSE